MPIGSNDMAWDKFNTIHNRRLYMKSVFMIVVLLVGTPLSFADDFNDKKGKNWHQWRGPDASGYAPHANPPIHWDSTTNIKWKSEIPGVGSSTPIVWDKRIFILTAIKTDKTQESSGQAAENNDSTQSGRRRFQSPAPKNYYRFEVICYDRDTGKIVWQTNATENVPHEGHHQTGSFASASPVTDGTYLYASFGSRGIYCYDLDGNQIWSQDLGDMQTIMSFGEGSSPALYKDSLIVNWDHEGQSFIVNLDAKTGTIKWKVDRDEPTTWGTPLIIEHEGVTQVIVNGTNKTRSYNLQNGNVVWECGGQTRNPIPSPIVYESMVLCTSGFRGSALFALPLSAKGDITSTDHILWSYNRNTPYVPSPLLYGTSLYFLKGNDAILTVVDVKSGTPILETTRLEEIQGVIYASPVGARDRVYFLNREGKALVMKHGGSFERLAVNTLDDEFNASPAMVDNQIFLRGKDFLYCIEEQ